MVFNFNFDKNFFKSNNDVLVTVQIPSQRPKSIKLNLDNKLSNIRKILENDNIINDTLSFSMKFPQNNDNSNYKFSEIVHEERFLLNEIVEIIDESHILHLIKNSPDWQTLINLRKLDYGCTMAFDGINIAKKRAFIIKNCELNLIGAEGYKKGRLEFESQNDWMEKTNLFFNVDGNITNFVKVGLSAGSSKNKNFNDEIKSAYEYTELGKVLLRLSKKNLKLTENFIDDMNNSIGQGPREFKKITEEYGQFIPTKIILGGRVYFKDFKISSENSAHMYEEISTNAGVGPSNLKIRYNSGDSKKSSKFYSNSHMILLGGQHPVDGNFNEKAWIESLEDYQNWRRIEMQNPISIFQLLPDDLRKKIFESIGKKILFKKIVEHNYFKNIRKAKIVDLTFLPSNISKILQNKEADCDIFATVIDTEESKNDFFNCQVLCSQDSQNGKTKSKPRLIIHCIQNKFRKHEYKLKIGIMIIGYDTEFDFLRPHFDIQFKVLKTKSVDFEHRVGLPCIGIPVLNETDSSNNSLVIGHHYYVTENKFRTYTFSYCLMKNHYVNSSNFDIYTLIILNPSGCDHVTLLYEYDKILNRSIQPYKPKYISLYSEGESYCGPIFPKQKSKQIKIKYLKCLNCEKSCSICKKQVSTENIKCKFFDPFDPYDSECSTTNLEQN